MAKGISSVSRRSVLKGAAAAGVIAGFPSIVRAQSKTLVTTLYGGIYEKNYRLAVIEPFEKKTGAKIEIKYGGSGEWFTSSVVNKDNPELDIAFLSLPVAMKAIKTKDVFIDLPLDLIPNAKDVDPIFYDLYDRKGVGFNYAPYGMVYRTDKVSPAPTSWGDLWKPEYAGKVLLPDLSGGGAYETIVIAAILNGGSETDLEPGYEALRKLKENVFRFYKNNNEPVPIYEQAQAIIGGWYSARAYAIADKGVPFDFTTPKEGSPVGVLSYHIAKNSPNRDLAVEFVNFSLSKEAQETFANNMEYGVVHKHANITGRARDRITPHDQLMRLDWKKIEPQMSAMAERWQREIVS
ncbi:MAG: ABC transporter substrate-binding protein [Alphaproteobacteria bacterium]|jgi:putative spermidine/putrescine transport system substrate-binding protein